MGAGNPEGSCALAMPLTTADIGIQLLMDSTVSLQEIEARITARVFAAVHHPERGPAVRAVLEQLLARTGCHQPRWGDLKRRFASLPCSGPLLGVPPADGAWRNLGGAGGPSTPCPLHSRCRAWLPCWGCDGPPHGTAPASFAPDPRGHRTRRKPDHEREHDPPRRLPHPLAEPERQ